MLELQRTVFCFKLDGQEYRLKKPTVGQFQEYDKKVKSTDHKNHLELLIDFLSSLGLPKDTAYGLEVGHLEAILEHLIDSKKK